MTRSSEIVGIGLLVRLCQIIAGIGIGITYGVVGSPALWKMKGDVFFVICIFLWAVIIVYVLFMCAMLYEDWTLYKKLKQKEPFEFPNSLH